MIEGLVLRSARLELRPPRSDDLAGIHAMMDDEETMRFLGSPESSLADDFSRLLRNAGSWLLYGYGIFMVREPGSDEIVGTCGVFRSFRGYGPQARLDDVIEAGWIIRRDRWGKGYAREAMAAVLDWFDRVHGAQRIACMIEHDNDASHRVARGLGFVAYGGHVLDDEADLVLYERG